MYMYMLWLYHPVDGYSCTVTPTVEEILGYSTCGAEKAFRAICKPVFCTRFHNETNNSCVVTRTDQQAICYLMVYMCAA